MKERTLVDNAVKISLTAQQNLSPQAIHAHCACIMDVETGETLYEKNADDRELPLCTAKILTCVIALERGQLDALFTIPAVTRAGSLAGVTPGEQMALRDMLYGMMLVSGNDLAEAVAVCISGSIPAFAAEINALAKCLGMRFSHFSMPSGVHKKGDYSCARDIALATRYALKNPVFREIITTPVYTCKSSLKEYTFENTNELIHPQKGYNNRKYPACIGGKTGSGNGRYCLVPVARKGHTHTYIYIGTISYYG